MVGVVYVGVVYVGVRVLRYYWATGKWLQVISNIKQLYH